MRSIVEGLAVVWCSIAMTSSALAGPQERTSHQANLDGALQVGERTVTHQSAADGREEVVIETYSRDVDGFVRWDDHLALSQRVRIVTTEAAGGCRATVEEVEARNPVAPGDPMRIVRRMLTKTCQQSPGRWVVDRQIFERDVNNRLVLDRTEREERTTHP